MSVCCVYLRIESNKSSKKVRNNAILQEGGYLKIPLHRTKLLNQHINFPLWNCDMLMMKCINLRHSNDFCFVVVQ